MSFLDDLDIDLSKRIDEIQDLKIKADFRLASVYLREFIDPYRQQCIRRREAVDRAASKNAMNNSVGYEYNKPILFYNNEPVKDLFLYNMRMNPGRKKLAEILKSCGEEDFYVGKIKTDGKKTCALIKCNTLAASTKIQCDIILKKIWIDARSGKRHYFSVKPDVNVFAGVGTELKLEKLKQHGPVPPAIDALRNPFVIRKILQDLQPEEVLNLMMALDGLREPCNNIGVTDLLLCHQRYEGKEGLEKLYEDARQFTFANMYTRGCRWEVDLSIIRKVIRYQRENKKEKIEMGSIDLTGVIINKEVLSDISDAYKVKELKLSKVKTVFDTGMLMEGLEEAIFVNSNETRLKFLSDERFQSLRILNLDNCKMLLIEHLFSFLQDNKTLEELYLTDVNSIDVHMPCWRVLEAVFNGNNILRIFHFKYPKDAVYEVTYEQALRENLSIREIDIENNLFIMQSVQEIINKSRVLEYLNIKGLEPKGEEWYDFSNQTSLKSIKMSYHKNIQRSLDSLNNVGVEEVVINNDYGENDKKNKNFDINFVLNVIRNVNRFKLEIDNCKVMMGSALGRSFMQLGAQVCIKEGMTKIEYKKLNM